MTGRGLAGRTAVGRVALCGALGLATVVGCRSARRTPEPPLAAPAGTPPGSRPAASIDDDDRDPSAPTSGTRDRVTIKISIDARWRAHVFWGRKDLGVAPLEVQRPRGSGPLDLLIVADGALPLHTRVFTDRDNALAVRLYGENDASGLLGYPRTFSLPTSARFTHNAGTFPRPRR